MTAPRKKAPPARPPELRIVLGTNGEPATVTYRLRVFRIMLDNGSTFDVVAHTDGSTLREAVLKMTGAERIAGVATIAEIDA